MNDNPTISEATAETAPWTRGPNSTAEGEPPHFLGGDLADPRHPNELGIVWADEAHTIPLQAQDWDGCYAVIASLRDKETAK